MSQMHPNKPCSECPWRTDVEVGHFEPERFEQLAKTAYDQSFVLFQCHRTPDGKPLVCAGFLLRGATHNLSARLNAARGAIGAVEDGGYPLFSGYREMSEANGVDPAHPALERVREDPHHG